jgi:hypothetical protein
MKHFALTEFTASETAERLGIDNTPPVPVITALNVLVDNVLDPLRELYGAPIVVNSGYRSPALNAMVGGVPSSQHVKGEAADIEAGDRSRAGNIKLFELIRDRLPFDQLINEHNFAWVHVSFSRVRNRKQALAYWPDNKDNRDVHFEF